MRKLRESTTYLLSLLLVMAYLGSCKKEEKDWTSEAAQSYRGSIVFAMVPAEEGKGAPYTDNLPLTTVHASKAGEAETLNVDISYALVQNINGLIFKQVSSDDAGAKYAVEPKVIHPADIVAAYSEIRILGSQSASYRASGQEFSFVLNAEVSKKQLMGGVVKYKGTITFSGAKGRLL